jgi:hypothetical protein
VVECSGLVVIIIIIIILLNGGLIVNHSKFDNSNNYNKNYVFFQ